MRACVLLVLAVGCLPAPVESVTLTPEGPHAAEIGAALRAADARWEAVGVAAERIVVGPGGSPVRLVPERFPVSETRSIWAGSVFRGVRWIELSSLHPDTVVHELGHSMGSRGHVLEELGDCALELEVHPMMCASAGPRILEQDLALICDSGDCNRFAPEGDGQR